MLFSVQNNHHFIKFRKWLSMLHMTVCYKTLPAWWSCLILSLSSVRGISYAAQLSMGCRYIIEFCNNPPAILLTISATLTSSSGVTSASVCTYRHHSPESAACVSYKAKPEMYAVFKITENRSCVFKDWRSNQSNSWTALIHCWHANRSQTIVVITGLNNISPNWAIRNYPMQISQSVSGSHST